MSLRGATTEWPRGSWPQPPRSSPETHRRHQKDDFGSDSLRYRPRQEPGEFSAADSSWLSGANGRHGPASGLPMDAAPGTGDSRIVALVSVWVSKRIQTALELRPLCGWNLDVCQYPPVIGAMVAVWKSEMFHLPDSLLRNVRSAPGLEAEDQLILKAGHVPGQHIAHVQLRHLVIAHVEHRIAHPFFWGIFSALSKPLPDSAVRLIERIINISNAQMGDVADSRPSPSREGRPDPILAVTGMLGEYRDHFELLYTGRPSTS